MQLKVLTPTRVAVDALSCKLIAEGPHGSFCLLPRHVDFVTTLVPGLFNWWDSEGNEHVSAVDEGTLVKVADEVLVSVREAIHGDNLENLRDAVEREFIRIDERERQARSALARLEAGAVRRAGGIGIGSGGGSGPFNRGQ